MHLVIERRSHRNSISASIGGFRSLLGFSRGSWIIDGDASRRRAMQTLTRDGIRLCYDEAGSGDPPILFVHGWCCDHTYFAPQFEHFRRTHRVIAVDQRGHGASDKPQQEYSMVALADDLAWLCKQLHIERPVVIGHSMGGVAALTLAWRFPEVPAAIATVDSPILLPAAVVDTLGPFIAALRGPGYRDVQRQFVADMLFIASDDPQRKARIIDAMSSAPQHVMASAFEQIFAFDHAAAAAACTVPWLFINTAHPPEYLSRLREACPQVTIGQTVGAGHFSQLEVPEQVNAMLDRFLTLAVKR
jgi:pimeloyl-ACP methyl ester carboxylesterase